MACSDIPHSEYVTTLNAVELVYQVVGVICSHCSLSIALVLPSCNIAIVFQCTPFINLVLCGQVVCVRRLGKYSSLKPRGIYIMSRYMSV